MTPDGPRHGTYAGYSWHRNHNHTPCDPCRDAAARYERGRQWDLLNSRPRTLPAIGSQRRIHALVALGYTFQAIGTGLGVSATSVNKLAQHEHQAYITARRAKAIADLYERWSMTLPPTDTTQQRRAATYARRVAARNGWLPPLAWDDDRMDDPTYQPSSSRANDHVTYDHAVVERILTGLRPAGHRLRPAESVEIVRRALASGYSITEIYARFGIKAERHTHPEGDTAA